MSTTYIYKQNMKSIILTLILSVCTIQTLLSKDNLLEIPNRYESELLLSTNKYSFATNALSSYYKNYPVLASDLTVLTIKHDQTNANRYITFFNERSGRRFNTNLLTPASLSSVTIRITSSDRPQPIQIQSYAGVDPNRP